MRVVQQLACEAPSNSSQPSPFSVASIVGKARALTADRESVRMQVPTIDLLTRLQAPRGTEPPFIEISNSEQELPSSNPNPRRGQHDFKLLGYPPFLKH